MIARRGNIPRRRPARRARRFTRVFEILICISVVGAFGYFFAKYAIDSRDFRVRRVAIDGLHYLDEGTVLAASGIAPDGNVFAFDEATVKSRIEKLPYVESCDVGRVYPDTVAITIRERVPAASLHVGRRAYEIDRSGVVLREYAPTEMPMDPFITQAPGVNFIQPGQPIDKKTARPALDAALAVWDQVRASGLSDRLRVSELAALRGNDVRMFCAGEDYEIRWGGEDVEGMARRLEVLWEKFDGHLPCFEYVDLRFGANVACK